MRLKVFWMVCIEQNGEWENVMSSESRAEVEADLLECRKANLNAFPVKVTMARMDQPAPVTRLRRVLA